MFNCLVCGSPARVQRVDSPCEHGSVRWRCYVILPHCHDIGRCPLVPSQSVLPGTQALLNFGCVIIVFHGPISPDEPLVLMRIVILALSLLGHLVADELTLGVLDVLGAIKVGIGHATLKAGV